MEPNTKLSSEFIVRWGWFGRTLRAGSMEVDEFAVDPYAEGGQTREGGDVISEPVNSAINGALLGRKGFKVQNIFPVGH
jgi:hypothetical protein